MAKVARIYKMYVVGGGIVEKEEDKFYDTSPILGPNGNIVGKYRKVNFWGSPRHDEVGSGLTAGTGYSVFKMEFGTAASYQWIDACPFLG